jgi:integrase/recombinase XerD
MRAGPAVLDGCQFVKIADMQSSAVVEYLGALRREGKSTKTANDYLDAVRGFSRWLWRDKRIGLNPLAGLSKLAGGDADLRHARRDFSPEELGRLLDAARTSPKSVRKLSGPDRHALYLTACSTGFRASELASMTPESFNLDSETPTAKVQAGCTKNRNEAVQPLPIEVAKALREYLADKPGDQPVWSGKWNTSVSDDRV